MRGAPDDSNVLSTSSFYRLDDMAELAARLGSVVQYRRSGNVIFADTFGSGANAWIARVLPADVPMSLVNLYCREDGVSLAGVMEADADAEVYMYHSEPPPLTAHIGITFGFFISDVASEVHVEIDVTTPTSYVEYAVMFDVATGVLSYYDAAGDPQAFATPGTLQSASPVLHVFKVVVDYGQNRYRRCYLNNLEYDMQEYTPAVSAAAHLPHVRYTLRALGSNLFASVFAVDNVVITQNEL